MSATGILSKNTKIFKKATGDADFIAIPDLQAIPDLGGSVETVEVTTLADGAHRYIEGLIDYGQLEFTFLYDNSTEASSYRIVRAIEESKEIIDWKVELPDGTAFTFTGSVRTTVAGVGAGDAMTFTAAITLNSEMNVENPVA